MNTDSTDTWPKFKRVAPRWLKTHEKLSTLFQINPDVQAAIEADIRARGFLDSHPIECGVWPGLDKWIVVDGHTRLRASEVVGVNQVPVCCYKFADETEAIEYAVHNQRDRRNLSAAELHKLIQVIDRPHEHGGDRRSEKFQVDPGRLENKSLVETAKTVGVSAKTIERSRLIASDPEIEKKVQAGEITSFKEGARQVQERRRTQALPANVAVNANGKRVDLPIQPGILKDRTQPVLEGQYGVIVIDPPWPYKKRRNDPTHRARSPYPAMSIEDIRQLPITSLAHDDCILWLWTTNAFLHEAFHCLEAWGFEYKTLLTWVKDKMGLGDWLRGKTEHCLLAIKGHPRWNLTNQSDVIRGRRREHSRKPESFYHLVEELCGGPRLEMFAREERPGWTAWGNETDKFNRVESKADTG